MPSLTPLDKAEQTSWAATKEGLYAGGLTLIPTAGAFWLAMRNKTFLKVECHLR